MWLMTKHGFYSIVEKEPDVFHVRSRERGDLEDLVKSVPLPGATIVASNATDYRFRIIVGKDQVFDIMRFLGDTIDYSNFKNRIAATAEQANKYHAYGEVWRVLAEDLGSYGRPGRTSSQR